MLSWVALAFIFFFIGFFRKERTYRLMALSILAVTALTLVPTIWSLSTDMKLLAFFGVGVAFISLGWIYHRYRDELNRFL